MININYDIWKEACDLIKKYAKTHGKFYLQLYPFYNYNNLNTISSESFFNSYVSNGAIFTNYSNFDRIDNYCRKSDGSYRNRFLLSPIIYIYYISIGLYFSKKYNQKRNKNIYVVYGASFDDGDLHYRNSYHKFVDYIVDNNSEYNYYYKLDISDFFNKIDIDLLTKLLANSLKFNQKEQMLFKEFIKWCGNGTFPQTECGVTSCYLATIVYFDIIDNKLYNSLIKEKRINKFKICRYVDDLYILLDIDGRINTDVIENRISSLYENLIYSYGLSINREKSKFNNFDNIFSDLKSFSIFEPNIITFHLEAGKNRENILKLIKLVKENNARVGMSLKPATPIEEIYQFLPYIHLVLIMTVEPGLGGQTLIPETIEKVKKLRKYIDEKELEVDIQADGGINLQNIELLKEAGIDNVVIGSALIKAEDKNDMINKLKK